ncbi:MAG: universal stress protein [Candidatus Binatia bacterium]|nr:universal stress protein [Candidatus Binatia bacterium]
MNIHTIVVPVDFSPGAEKAFAWALALAEKWQARVLLLHVVSLPISAPVVMGVHVHLTDLEAALLEDAKVKMRELLARSRSETVQIEAKVTSGHPVAAICRTAEQEQADLIVIGSHGRTGLRHLLLGSVAEQVVRYAPCPVAVVGKTARVAPGQAESSHERS